IRKGVNTHNMFPIESSENSTVTPFNATNGVDDKNNNIGTIPCHLNINRPSPSVYSANTTMLSFNNVEQSYTRVVGQVYSRETVTTIYGDPPTNFWNQRQIGCYCYICRSAINPHDLSSLISCASPTCDVYVHSACLIVGIQERNVPWYCQRCVSTTRHDIYLPSNNNVEGNDSSTTQMNPLHLLLEASDHLQSSSGPENNSAVVHSHFSRRDSTITQQQHDKNPDSPRANLINSGESTLNQSPIGLNMNISSFNGSESGSREETEIAVEKFECQYTSFDEERNNLIRNLERTRTRQNQVTDALKESVTRLTREHTKHLDKRDSLLKDNRKLNSALHKLKLALIPLAQEKPVLQVLQKVTQNDELQGQDINLDNVLSLFMKLLPKSTLSVLSSLIENALPPFTTDDASASSSVHNVSSSASLLSEACQRCSEKGGDLISCSNCQRVQHVECFGKEENVKTGEQWMCDGCKNATATKRKHCGEKNSGIKFPNLTLIGNYKRIRMHEKEGTSKSNSISHNINTCNIDNGDGVLSPQLTPHQTRSTNGNVPQKEEGSDQCAMPNTPMSGDNESSDDSILTSEGSEIEAKNHRNDLIRRNFDRTPPPDNGPEASRQPARFDGDMYTPRWVRGVGKSKEGLCPHCEPSRWLKTKISAYWYHLNYQHGISSITGRPFTQPTAERINKKTGMKEAMCHKCNKWILNQSPRDKEVLVPEIYW
ncbi:12231_t:CDS:2, partial [Acaulospora morrowiae]